MALVLISPVNLESFPEPMREMLKEKYQIGWLNGFTDGAVYSTWGMSRNKEDALIAVKNWLEKNKNEEAEVIIYNYQVPKKITLDELQLIKQCKPIGV